MSFFERILYYQKTNRVASHILFWLFVLLISLSSSKYYDGNGFTIRFALIGNGLYLIPQIIATYFLTYFIIPLFFFQKKYKIAVISFIAGSYLICALSRFLIVRVAEPLAGIAPKAFETNDEIMTDLPKLLYVYFFHIFSLAFVFLFVKLLKDQLDIQKRALTMQKEKTETELRLLKSQMNPHFLFNTLNNIYALSLVNSPVTSSSIGRLGEILDYILYRCNDLLVPLSGEITLLNNYIGLEKLRYDERLTLNFVIDQARDIDIAPLILLSIVENAFKHGTSHDIGNVSIDINLHVDDTALRFVASNTCKRTAATEIPASIGLPNLRQQLELIYPRRHQLSITRSETHFTVTLIIDIP
jgi:Histidine kinase